MIDQHTLYIDNFRGFNNTFIPLLDVNFLVGENTSGKTSVLNLLKLMSGDRLLTANEFSDEDINLGTFHDLVSAHSEDRKYFRIGMIRRNTGPAGAMPMGVLIKYESLEGLPSDTRVTCTFNAKEVSVRRVGARVFGRVRENAITASTKMADLFAAWSEEQDGPDDGYRELKVPSKLSQS